MSKERNDNLSSIVPSKTPWQCKPEFSTDKMVGDNRGASGAEQSQFQPSVRLVIGALGLCGSHRRLSEQGDINGRCFEDYTCECDSGFELKSTARDSEVCHACESEQDCLGGRHVFQ